MEDVRQG